MKKKNIFLDLDETLISSVYCSSKKFMQDYISTYIDYESCSFILPESSGFYVTFLRPIAFDIIEYCENLVGEENVYVLTASTDDYSNALNKGLGLGFKPEEIYHRELIYYARASGDIVEKFKDSDNILIDNLSHRDHASPTPYGSKGEFLGGLDRDRYVQINPFSIDHVWHGFKENDRDYFETELKTKIQKAVEYDGD